VFRGWCFDTIFKRSTLDFDKMKFQISFLCHQGILGTKMHSEDYEKYSTTNTTKIKPTPLNFGSVYLPIKIITKINDIVKVSVTLLS
jgi:hypothetical protein